ARRRPRRRRLDDSADAQERRRPRRARAARHEILSLASSKEVRGAGARADRLLVARASRRRRDAHRSARRARRARAARAPRRAPARRAALSRAAGTMLGFTVLTCLGPIAQLDRASGY